MRQPINRRTLSALLLVALGMCAAASLLAGDVAVHISAVWTWLCGGDTENSQFYAILFEQIRSPRIVLAAMTGFVLGLSGRRHSRAVSQSIGRAGLAWCL
jgi:ABC-type enterobactin transport system permease subunit